MTYAATVAPFVDRCLFGDAREMLATVPDGVVQCCVTSPPYWGLRDYSADGQLGLEATPDEYVTNLVAVCREIRRVLRPDGTLWLNLGDSYSGSGVNDGTKSPGLSKAAARGNPQTRPGANRWSCPIPRKNLVGIPWRAALALQADGWVIRSDIVWAKPSCMPEPVTDRPVRSHEYVFLLAPEPVYFYDAVAVREADGGRSSGNVERKVADGTEGRLPTHAGRSVPWDSGNGRNQRDVWTINPKPYPRAHHAVFPPEIPRRAIAAGTSERGCCPVCGAPWARVVERGDDPNALPLADRPANGRTQPGNATVKPGTMGPGRPTRTTGWRPTCDHDETQIPCLVLDPFMGSGTTAMVAQDLGRRWLGCELNRDYEPLQRERTQQLGLLAYAP